MQTGSGDDAGKVQFLKVTCFCSEVPNPDPGSQSEGGFGSKSENLVDPDPITVMSEFSSN